MTEEELQTRVIENIRVLRKMRGLSQEKLADKADISRQMMNDIEGRRLAHLLLSNQVRRKNPSRPEKRLQHKALTESVVPRE